MIKRPINVWRAVWDKFCGRAAGRTEGKKTDFMTLKECYRILELPRSADLDEIKKAYRRLAFALHPDLNPGMPEAVRRFQEVNEAYVLLSKTLQDESRRDPRVQHRKPPADPQAQPQTQAHPRAAAQAQARTKAKAHAEAQARARAEAEAQAQAEAKAKAQAHAEAKAQAEAKARARAEAQAQAAAAAAAQVSSRRPDPSQTTPAGSARNYMGSSGPTAEKPRPGAAAGAFGQAGPRAEQYGPAGAKASRASDFDLNRVSGKIFSQSDNAATTARQEEVLGEILNDPFARRVFEDIYSELKKEHGPGGPKVPSRPAKPKKKKKLSLEWGKRKMSVDLTHGFFGAIKSWLRGQLDQEQTLEMPAAGIVPGARLRLQVHLGMFGDNQSVEVTIPPDYSPGAPIRLKGLGRKLGAWRGDLYLRVVPQGVGGGA